MRDCVCVCVLRVLQYCAILSVEEWPMVWIVASAAVGWSVIAMMSIYSTVSWLEGQLEIKAVKKQNLLRYS